ncbi:hypothetical protein ACKWTF_007106 [Chironomus riparius]
MKNCNYCNKRASIYDKKIKCRYRSCKYFVHKDCLIKRSRTHEENFNWTCKLHLKLINIYVESDESNENMALPRTPVNNDNNNEQREVEILEDPEYEIQQNLENTLISPNSHDNIAGDIEEDSFHDFDQSQIIRSTSFDQNSESRIINNNNNPQNSNTIKNIVNNSSVVPNLLSSGRKAASLFNNTPKKPIKTCNVCKKDASRHGFVCYGCNKVCHPICLLDEEEEEADSQTDSYLCLKCMKIMQNINSSCRKSPKINNLNNCPPTSSNNNYNHTKFHHDCYPDVASNKNYDRKDIQHNNCSRNHNVNEKISFNNNSLGNSELEIYFIKLQYQKLPIVTDSDLSWTVFYSSFVRTKGLFDPDENVIRIQAAIKDETVKRIGGKGLFNPKTYDKCIEDVNKRLKHNINFLSKEAALLEKHGRIKDENKLKLVEYIDQVRNFATLAIAYKDFSYSSNRRFLANIINVVPTFIRNKWESKQAELEEINIVPTLKHLIEIFEKELPRIEASIRNDELLTADKRSDIIHNSKHQKSNDKSHRSYYSKEEGENPFIADENTLASKENLSNNSTKTVYCWFHKQNGHSGNRCKDLWKLDGKIVSELAKNAKICTCCGQTQHNPCTYNTNLKCRITGCDKLHHSLFCYKRKVPGSQTNANNYQNNNKIPSLMLEDTSSEDEEKMTTKNLNTNNCYNNEENLNYEIVDNLINNQFYTNVPQELKDHLIKNKNYQRNSHIISDISNFAPVELKINKSKIDTGRQTSFIEKNVKTYNDASTQTSVEEFVNLNDKFDYIEINSESHNILHNCKQNETRSTKFTTEWSLNQLNLDVKHDTNDKISNNKIQYYDHVTKCIKKSLNTKLRLRKLTRKVTYKSRKKKIKYFLSNPYINKTKVHKTKHKNMHYSDSKRHRKKESNNTSNRTNHEFSKLISFIPGTKMKEELVDDNALKSTSKQVREVMIQPRKFKRKNIIIH